MSVWDNIVMTPDRQVFLDQIQELISLYQPGIRVNMPYLQTALTQAVCKSDTSRWSAVAADAREFILLLVQEGYLDLRRGSTGGIKLEWLKDPNGTTPALTSLGSRVAALYPQTTQTADVPPSNYKCGCGCDKLNTSNDKVCWRCGEPVKGYIGG